jgi:hypothetical protein
MYDSKTVNGIPYIKRLYEHSFRYQTVVDDLDALKPQKTAVMSGEAIQTHTTGSWSVTHNVLSASDVTKMWNKLMAEKERLESGKKPRRTVGVVHRDW